VEDLEMVAVLVITHPLSGEEEEVAAQVVLV